MEIGGVRIKLKLGKDEPVNSPDTTTAGTPPTIPAPPKTTSTDKPESVENLRKVIKFDQKPAAAEPQKKPEATTEKPAPKEQPAQPKPDPVKTTPLSPDAARDDLEQRRTILQNLKDFDFQIKKNQEDITSLTEKVENLSKDLDDLVSLYEIVSEQMNPFVGLSKVTKKRLDALEHITAEVETLKTKLGELETSATTLPQPKQETSRIMEKTTTPAAEPQITPQTQPTPPTTQQPPTQDYHTTPPQEPQPIHTPSQPMTPLAESFIDTELDVLLSKALDSIVIEQQIDTLMKDFFSNFN